MSGLTANLIGNDLFQRFTADGTWKKPAGIKMVCIEAIGGGGSGAGGSGYSREAGSAGGGGALVRKYFSAASIRDVVSESSSKKIFLLRFSETVEINFEFVSFPNSLKLTSHSLYSL